jgi:hypothetical protein
MSMVQHTGDSVSVKITAHDAFADAASTSCYSPERLLRRETPPRVQLHAS